MNARRLLLATACLAAACNPDVPAKVYLDRYQAPLHIAHRGGGDELPEHTLYAYDFSLTQHGTDVLEIDVHRTCDGQLVIAHDDNLDRVAMQPARIKDVTLAFLRSLRIPFPTPPPGAPDARKVVPVSDPRLLRVPTLKEVVDRYRNCLINLEIKDPDATDQVIALLRAKEAEDRAAGASPAFDLNAQICFASFSDQVSQKVQLALPGACHTYPTYAAACASLPRKLPGPLRLAPRTCPDYDLFALPDWLIDAPLVRSIHDMDRRIYAWTINERPRMEQLLDMNVDAIMTDRPSVLREVFRARGLPTRQERPDPRGPCVIAPVPLEDSPAPPPMTCKETL